MQFYVFDLIAFYVYDLIVSYVKIKSNVFLEQDNFTIVYSLT